MDLVFNSSKVSKEWRELWIQFGNLKQLEQSVSIKDYEMLLCIHFVELDRAKDRHSHKFIIK